MKIQIGAKRTSGLTRQEVVLVITGVVLIGGALLLPRWFDTKRESMSARCVSNLKQISLADKNWLDHGGRFPWEVSTNKGGTMEWDETPDVFRHLQVNSNELQTPRVLVCPTDKRRKVASSFASRVSNANVSYFVGLDADDKNPESIVHGDRNITGGEPTRYGFRFIQTNKVAWATTNMHMGNGNVVAADGSVMALNSASLRELLKGSTNTEAAIELRLAIPRVPGEH